MRLLHLISRIGLISKWPLQWIYYEINMDIFHKLAHLLILGVKRFCKNYLQVEMGM